MRYERDRAEFPLLLNEWGLLERGVEVGVCRGEFSHNLLSYWPGFLHLVDPWQKTQGYEEDYDHTANYLATLDKLKEHEGRFMVHRKTSLEASHGFDQEALDFAYLDANHAYKAVLNDLEMWWPKVKVGGILAGDDYGIIEEQWVDFGHGRVKFGVKKAVDEFAHDVGRNVSIDFLANWKNLIPGKGELQARGWWLVK
jgi:hypothetical protein